MSDPTKPKPRAINLRAQMLASMQKKAVGQQSTKQSTKPARPVKTTIKKPAEATPPATPVATAKGTNQPSAEQATPQQRHQKTDEQEENPLLINRSIPSASICWGCKYRLMISFEPGEVWKCRRAFTEVANVNGKRRLAYYSWVTIPFGARKEDCSKVREARGAIWTAEPKYSGFYSMLPKGHAVRKNEGIF